MNRIRIKKTKVDLRQQFDHRSADDSRLLLTWLGQAGFLICHKAWRVLIDPYLSDHLAKKYAGKRFPHRRMMPAPIDPAEISGEVTVLCTHRHSDHMDPEALPVISHNHPKSSVILPSAEQQHAQDMGIPSAQITPINAFDTLDLYPNLSLTALPSAHENFKINDQGRHHYLGYILRVGRLSIYHSGDCVPFAELGDLLQQHRVDVALLPVNGRSEYLRQHNVAGNFHLEEAIQLCRDAQIPLMLGHHFKMFDFNTLDSSQAEAILRRHQAPPEVYLCESGVTYVWEG